jgi:hypothetical protein
VEMSFNETVSIARLFAASPDLYTELSNLVGTIENLSRHMRLADVDLVLMSARAALARAADGEEN